MKTSNVPDQLRETDHWICWREEERDGDLTKIPVDPQNGGFAKANDPETWTDFDTALTFYENKDVTGLGFVFSENDLLAGVDLDDCRDPESGDLNDDAMEIMERLDSYTEVSPSGTGLHIIVHGFIPDGGNRKNKVEMYDHNRFFTMTGDHVPGTEKTVKTRRKALQSVHSDYIGSNSENNEPAQPATDISLDDEELIKKAKNAKNGDQFESLWNGNISNYGSNSEADLALCSMLAFWTGGDKQQIKQLFGQSGLVREKWRERPDYRKRTIQKAINGTSDYYEPNETEESPAPVQDESTDEATGVTTTINWRALRDRFQDSDVSVKQARNEVGNALRKKYHFKTMKDTETLWVFKNPVYEPEGQQFVRQHLHHNLGTVISKNDVNEIVEKLRAATFFERPEGHEYRDIIPVKNGYYNVETETFHDPSPERFLTNELPLEYDADADCPKIKDFLGQIVKEDTITTLQEWIGYLMYTDYPIAKALMLVGSGKNGKSTFLNLLQEFIGETNIANPSLHELTENNFAKAELYGKLANICGDLDANKLERTGNFKTLTGGDVVRAERKYESAFSFRNYAKLMYSANELPRTQDTTDAFFRRWMLIEFPYKFTENPTEEHEKPKDADIEEKITTDEELSGLFNWAMKGLQRLLEQGHFTENTSMNEVKTEWLAKSQPLEVFCDQYVVVDYGDCVTKDRFYKMYQRFCETHHAPMMSKSWLGRNLKDIVPEIVGDKRRIGGSSVRVWSNIRIEGTSFESESDEDSGNGGDEAGSGLASADDADTADDATDKSQSGEEEGGESQPDSENSDSGKSLNSVDSGTGKNSPIAHAGARNEYIEKQFRQMPGPLSQNKDDQEVIKTFDSVTTDTLREAISDVTSETGRDFAAVDELEPYFTLSADELENNLQKLKRDGDVYKPRGAGYAVV